MYAENELLYPNSVTPHLENMRSPEWKALVNRIRSLPESHEEVLAFCLMMIRLNGCMACETDSYRAMKGCLPCTAQTLRRYKGPDSDLFRIYDQSLQDIRHHVQRSAPAVDFLPITEVA